MHLKPLLGKPKPTADEAIDDAATRPVDETLRAACPAAGSLVIALCTQRHHSTQAYATALDRRLLDRQIQAAIGAQLRILYNDIVIAPVPDRLLKQLDELAAKAPTS